MSETGERPGPVLVVEDDEDTRNVLGDVLLAEGYEVELAPSAERALEMLAGGLVPSIILSDLCLPGMGGDELAALLLRDPICARISVVIMTAAPAAIRGPVLPKPFGVDDLLAVLPGRVATAEPASTRVGLGPRGLEAVA
jgi:CheY-like chemotaxis protein